MDGRSEDGGLAKYAPRYGGFCGFDPAVFTAVSGKLYLNHNRDVQSGARTLVAKAGKNWPAVSVQTKVIE